jgi:ribosomal protein S18 acetylase RimI-like enzyme
MVTIERLAESDWAAFREIRLRSLLDAPDAYGSTYGEESASTERAWRDWAAGRWRGGTAAVFAGRAAAGAVVGTATGAAYDAEESVAHVYAMWVAPDARGAGVGRALLDAVEGWARDGGRTRLVLAVTETNEGARRFYEACGYVDTGERHPLREGSSLRTMIFAKPI